MFMPWVFAPPMIVLGSGGSPELQALPVHTVVAINRRGTTVSIMNRNHPVLAELRANIVTSAGICRAY